MKTAVEAVFIGKDRQFNRRFQTVLGTGDSLVTADAIGRKAGWG
jgi:hypothetical protein